MILEKNRATYLILVVALFSAIYNIFIPLHGDEAYYWVWSNNLQGGYYDHAPLVAYFINFFTFFSESEFFIRLTNVFCMSISAFYIYKIAYEFFDKQVATYALLIFFSVPLVHAGMIITTPDSPLILFWTLSLYFTLKAINDKKTIYYVLTGIALGLAMLSKYTAILLVFSILLYFILAHKDQFKNRNFYLTIVIAVIVVSPMIYWNYQNDWISFLFQLQHGGMDNTTIDLNYTLEYLGGQFGVFTPVFFVLALMASFSKEIRENKNAKLLLIAYLLPFLFFMYKSLYARMEVNYAAPAYISASLIVAYYVSKANLQKAFKIGLILSITLTLVARFAFMFYLVYVQDRMVGFKESIAILEKHRESNDSFYGNHLTTTALLNYYLSDQPTTNLAINSRFSQYDMWKKPLKKGLVLSYEDIKSSLNTNFNNVKEVDSYGLYKGEKLFKTFHIYRVSEPK
ncbi:MAG: phospholipid carrier-dependent glycosyltransferase [Helicobacteraceae bacterium]|nr:phospholipid carrier-dependent glycosyltransferase [Helicobacteraceae bacterium]